MAESDTGSIRRRNWKDEKIGEPKIGENPESKKSENSKSSENAETGKTEEINTVKADEKIQEIGAVGGDAPKKSYNSAPLKGRTGTADFLPEYEPDQDAPRKMTARELYGWNAIPLSELEKIDIAEPEFIWDGHLPEHGSMALAGEEKLGKSWLAIGLGLCISCGKPFLGKKTKQRNVIYLNLEIPPTFAIKDRMLPIVNGFKPDEATVAKEHFIPVTPFSADLNDPIARGMLVENIRKYDVGVVIVDTMRASHRGEENSSTEEIILLGKLQEISRRQGVSWIFIHHIAKIKPDRWGRKRKAVVADMRGSSALAGFVDSVVILNRTEGKMYNEDTIELDLTQETNRFSKPLKKIRVLTEVKPTFVTISYVEVEENKPQKKNADETAADEILSWAMKTGQKFTVDDVVSSFGISVPTVRRAIGILETKKMIREGKKAGRKITYSLAAKEKKEPAKPEAGKDG